MSEDKRQDGKKKHSSLTALATGMMFITFVLCCCMYGYIVIPQLAEGRADCAMFHTAGSMPMFVFGSLRHHGVIYPMQTFSKECKVDFSRIPIFIEASSEEAMQRAEALATSVSSDVRHLSSDERRYLHLAAVFACNFANHCYTLAADILERHGLPFSVMLPLIEETARKATNP